MLRSIKLLPILTVVFSASLIAVTFAQDAPTKKSAKPIAERPKNLKVLPKKTTFEDIHGIMVGYSKSLGVRCTYCHVSTGEGKEMKFDWASDAKPTKDIARSMMKMTRNINVRYIGKMGQPDFESVTCATCHMGHIKPLVSVDSLPKEKS